MRYLWLICLLFLSYDADALEVNVADKAIYKIQLAQTNEELARGLMFIKAMPEDEGMLFDLRQFPGAKMWMRNTYISLDMVFIDCEYRVVDIKANCQPEDEQPIGSESKFCYILEINGGETIAKKIAIGDKLKF